MDKAVRVIKAAGIDWRFVEIKGREIKAKDHIELKLCIVFIVFAPGPDYHG